MSEPKGNIMDLSVRGKWSSKHLSNVPSPLPRKQKKHVHWWECESVLFACLSLTLPGRKRESERALGGWVCYSKLLHAFFFARVKPPMWQIIWFCLLIATNWFLWFSFFFYLYGDFLFAMRRNLRQIAVNVHTRKIRKRRGETVRFLIETSLGTVDSG